MSLYGDSCGVPIGKSREKPTVTRVIRSQGDVTSHANENPGEVGVSLDQWLGDQNWVRDTDEPCVSLGPEGAFDDTHLFAPAVVAVDGAFRLYYCGSQGEVEARVFRMGLSASDDGVYFDRHPIAPVLSFEGRQSVLTPTFLRSADGNAIREHGRFRLWFSSTTFPPGAAHTIHETSSEDGIVWDSPSAAQVSETAYAPTVLKDDDRYRMWYTDVSALPWTIRYAESEDGHDWEVRPDPVLTVDQAWEHDRLVYPTVLKRDGVYLMWYGSYSEPELQRTAIGFAVSRDGISWTRHPGNPVFEPDPSRSWESHYTTSQSLLIQEDGSIRMWYASRTKPPFTHKYFAIGTAVWRNAFGWLDGVRSKLL